MVNYFETYLNTTYRQCRELTNFGDLDLIFKKHTVALLKGQVLIRLFFAFSQKSSFSLLPIIFLKLTLAQPVYSELF